MDIFSTLQEEKGRLSQSESRIADIIAQRLRICRERLDHRARRQGRMFRRRPSPASAAGSAARAFPTSRCSSRAPPMSACATSSRSRRAPSRPMSRRTSSPRRRMRCSCCTVALDLAAIEQASNKLAERRDDLRLRLRRQFLDDRQRAAEPALPPRAAHHRQFRPQHAADDGRRGPARRCADRLVLLRAATPSWCAPSCSPARPR